MMNNRQKLKARLMNKFDSFENYADAPGPIALPPNKTTLQAAQGNPAFTAQFDVTFKLRYFTESSDVYTSRSAAYVLANAPTLANKLPIFLFGNSDFGGGFARLRTAFPLTNWSYDVPFIYGVGVQPACAFGVLDATAKSDLTVGDLVLPFYAVSGGVNYLALAIVHCNQVAYGTLLDALSSDMFQLNMIRYIMSDTTSVGLAQYTNNINIFKQSLFGKFDSDFISPNSFKLPEQMQDGVIDIPLLKGIDKQIALATLQNYDAIQVQWSIFVSTVAKLAY